MMPEGPIYIQFIFIMVDIHQRHNMYPCGNTRADYFKSAA